VHRHVLLRPLGGMSVNKMSAGAVCVAFSLATVTLFAGGCAHAGRVASIARSMGPEARSRRFAECAESFRMDRKYCTDHCGRGAAPENEHMLPPCLDGANRSFTNCIDGIE